MISLKEAKCKLEILKPDLKANFSVETLGLFGSYPVKEFGRKKAI